MSDYIIIPGTESARSLVYATWLRSYEASSLAAKHIPRDVFFAEHHKVIDRVLGRGASVRVAALPDEPDVILGWAVTEGPVVHYVYVKPPFRKHGMATALLADAPRPFTFSHWTHVLRDLHPKMTGCVYNPYLAVAA